MVLSPTLGDITQLHNQHNMSEEKCVNLAVGGPTPLIVVNFTWFIRLCLQMQALSVFVLHMTALFLPFPSKHNLKSSLVAWTRHFQQSWTSRPWFPCYSLQPQHWMTAAPQATWRRSRRCWWACTQRSPMGWRCRWHEVDSWPRPRTMHKRHSPNQNIYNHMWSWGMSFSSRKVWWSAHWNEWADHQTADSFQSGNIRLISRHIWHVPVVHVRNTLIIPKEIMWLLQDINSNRLN